MPEYSVVYTREAEDRLLDLFVASADRRAFEDASHRSERQLAVDPWAEARHLTEGLYTADAEPIRLTFEVRQRDSTVLIVHVGRFPRATRSGANGRHRN